MCRHIRGAAVSVNCYSPFSFWSFSQCLNVSFSLPPGEWHDLKTHNETVEPALPVSHTLHCPNTNYWVHPNSPQCICLWRFFMQTPVWAAHSSGSPTWRLVNSYLKAAFFLVSKETCGSTIQWCVSSLLLFQVIVLCVCQLKKGWLSRNRMFLSQISCLSTLTFLFRDAEWISQHS